MEPDPMETLLTQLKGLSESIGQAAKRLDTNDNALVKVGDRVGTVEDSMKRVLGQIEAVERVLRGKSDNIVPGLADEAKKNGGVNPISVLFERKGRDYALVEEYTKKRLEVEPWRAEQRTMQASEDSKGAVFIPSILVPGYVDQIRERSLLYRSSGGPGITVWPDLNGTPVELPTIDSNTTVAAASENEAPTASEITTGMIRFEPRAIKGLVKISKRLMRMGSLAARVVRENFVRTAALEIDRQGLRGSGTSKESLGVVNTPGILSIAVGTNGGNWTLQQAAAQKHKLRQNNVMPGPASAYVGHPDVFYTARTERIAQYTGQTAGAYVMLPMDDAMLRAQIGPHFDSTIFPTTLAKGSTTTGLTEVIYGDWADLWLAIWEDLTFSVSADAGTAFEQSETWVKVEMEHNFKVVQPLSFVLCNDASSVTL